LDLYTLDKSSVCTKQNRYTIRSTVEGEGRLIYQVPSGEMVGIVRLQVSPGDAEGTALHITWEVRGGEIPIEFQEAIIQGIVEGFYYFSARYWPLHRLKLTITGGGYHAVDSSERSFRLASKMAFVQAMLLSEPLLQPPQWEDKNEFHEPFAELRELLLTPSLQNWLTLLHLVAFSDEEEQVLLVDYAEKHLESWDDRLRVFYDLHIEHPAWRLVRHLDLSGHSLESEGAILLAETPELVQCTSLSLFGNQLRSEGLHALLASPYLGNICHLDLRSNQLETLKELLSWEHLPHLKSLDIGHNDFNFSEFFSLYKPGMMKSMEWLSIVNNPLDAETKAAFQNWPLFKEENRALFLDVGLAHQRTLCMACLTGKLSCKAFPNNEEDFQTSYQHFLP